MHSQWSLVYNELQNNLFMNLGPSHLLEAYRPPEFRHIIAQTLGASQKWISYMNSYEPIPSNLYLIPHNLLGKRVFRSLWGSGYHCSQNSERGQRNLHKQGAPEAPLVVLSSVRGNIIVVHANTRRSNLSQTLWFRSHERCIMGHQCTLG